MLLEDGSMGENLFEQANSNHWCICCVYKAAVDPEMLFVKKSMKFRGGGGGVTNQEKEGDYIYLAL